MDEDLKKLAEDVAEMKIMVKGIKNHFVRAEIYQWLVIVLIIAPVVVGLIMLWPQIKSLSGQYGNIMSNGLNAVTGNDLNQ